ncbi:helix-turn-helix transcriptional regulator [uncultured Martelella sp.]|uniref:helix-turn-helix domain-containing protein n=1 Tax=uncultured Martelella sp. TaxID=392331 RepID=UPI0029C79AE0|nr:helix-turn-helix transcriptional regulator [uncultured Martelella sp.]
MILPIQCKMARAAVGWGVRDLAKQASVSVDTVSRFERGEDLLPRTIEALQSAFERAGVIFVEANGEGPGVRLQKGL